MLFKNEREDRKKVGIKQGRKGKKEGGKDFTLVKYQLREHGIKTQSHSLNQIPLLIFL